jgi:hypothetical protein
VCSTWTYRVPLTMCLSTREEHWELMFHMTTVKMILSIRTLMEPSRLVSIPLFSNCQIPGSSLIVRPRITSPEVSMLRLREEPTRSTSRTLQAHLSESQQTQTEILHTLDTTSSNSKLLVSFKPDTTSNSTSSSMVTWLIRSKLNSRESSNMMCSLAPT